MEKRREPFEEMERAMKFYKSILLNQNIYQTRSVCRISPEDKRLNDKQFVRMPFVYISLPQSGGIGISTPSWVQFHLLVFEERIQNNTRHKVVCLEPKPMYHDVIARNPDPIDSTDKSCSVQDSIQKLLVSGGEGPNGYDMLQPDFYWEILGRASKRKRAEHSAKYKGMSHQEHLKSQQEKMKQIEESTDMATMRAKEKTLFHKSCGDVERSDGPSTYLPEFVVIVPGTCNLLFVRR